MTVEKSHDFTTIVTEAEQLSIEAVEIDFVEDVLFEWKGISEMVIWRLDESFDLVLSC